MSRRWWMFVWVAAAAVAGLQAAEENAQLEKRFSPAIMVTPPKEPFDLWDGFKGAFERHVDEVFASQFHPLNAMNWTLKLSDDDPGPLRERHASAARQAFSKSVLYGLREATVDLPVMSWLEDRQALLVGIFENSLGSVEEESVAPLSLSYQQAERSWWQSMSEGGRMRFGIRPLRTDPYAYVSFRIKEGNRILLLTNVRYHYVNFADHSFEFALSVPLARGLSMNLGTSYQFGRHDEEKRVALKLTKEFKHGSILHVGLEVRERPALVAGFTIPM